MKFLIKHKPLYYTVFGAVENFVSEEDKEIFNEGVHVVIATPKLVSILMTDGIVKPEICKMIIVDSAEEMQDAGYTGDLVEAFNKIPEAPLPPDLWDKAILEEGRRRIQTQLCIFATDITPEVSTDTH